MDTDQKERLLLEGKTMGHSSKGLAAAGAIGARQGEADDENTTYADGRKGGFDPHARIPDMDLDGIDAVFLYPTMGLFVGAVNDPPLAAALCRAYNRWLADYCKPYPDRLFGVAMLPLQSLELSIEEMRFAREELGDAGGVRAAQSVPRADAASPGLRAVLGGGAGPGHGDRGARGWWRECGDADGGGWTGSGTRVVERSTLFRTRWR